MTPTIERIIGMINAKQEADPELRRPKSMRVPRAVFEWAVDEFEHLPGAAKFKGDTEMGEMFILCGVDIFPDD